MAFSLASPDPSPVFQPLRFTAPERVNSCLGIQCENSPGSSIDLVGQKYSAKRGVQRFPYEALASFAALGVYRGQNPRSRSLSVIAFLPGLMQWFSGVVFELRRVGSNSVGGL